MSRTLVESRRTQYTRKVMQDTLTALLRDRPLASISVKELCRQADVNRSTFYAHYTNLGELLHEMEEETLTRVRAALASALAQTEEGGIEEVISEICRYIADNRGHLQVLMSPRADLGFQQDLLRLIYSRGEMAKLLQSPETNPIEMQMRLHFAVAGSIGLIQYWLATDLAAPMETLARTIYEMSMPRPQ